MTKHISSILLVVCICIFAQAQTPYDFFAPHISRPILDVEAVSSHKAATHISQDTIFYKSVIDPHQGLILLTDVSSGKIIAYVPITDDIHKWLSPDPLLDKYPGISPYAYCNWNPVKYIDPDGRDWYEAEDGTGVLWKKSNDASFNIDGATYNNIGENYNHVVGNTTYNYHQNKLQSIAYSTNTEFRQQTTGTSCKTTCEEMVRSSGFIPEAGRAGEILMTTHDANGVVNGPSAVKVLNQGLCRLEDYLTNGMPCIIGIDYKAEQKHNLAPNGDGMTDHFVTIVGMMYNVQNGTTTYNFYDPGSQRGANINNIITFNGTYLKGLTAARFSPFKVTTIRKNK